MLRGGDALQGHAAPALHPAGGQRGGEACRPTWASPEHLPEDPQGASCLGLRESGPGCGALALTRTGPGLALAPDNPPPAFQHSLLPQPPRSKYIHPDDELVLEDELQRIRLEGTIAVSKLVTGGAWGGGPCVQTPGPTLISQSGGFWFRQWVAPRWGSALPAST